MVTMREAAARFRALFNTRALDHDLDQELEAHLTMLTEDNIRTGMAPEDARRAAMLRVGHLGTIKDQHREFRGVPAIDALLQDLRFACTRLIRDRWFTLAAMLALAIGIGANSAVFTIV